MERTVRMSDTDATGYTYFTAQQKFAIEMLEAHLERLDDKNLSLPIVDIQASYEIPLALGEKVRVLIDHADLSKHSFTLFFVIKTLSNRTAATIRTTHVVLDSLTRQKRLIPTSLKDLLEHLSLRKRK